MMRGVQDSSNSSNKKEDDLILITDIEGSYDNPVINSNTNCEDTSRSSYIWVIDDVP